MSSQYADSRLAMNLSASLREGGSATLSGAFEVSARDLRDPRRFSEHAQMEQVVLEVHDLPAVEAASWAPSVDVAVERGSLSAKVTAWGTLNEPDVESATLVADDLVFDGWQPLRVETRFAYGGDLLRLERLWVGDRLGEWLLVEGLAKSSAPTHSTQRARRLAAVADARMEPGGAARAAVVMGLADAGCVGASGRCATRR